MERKLSEQEIVRREKLKLQKAKLDDTDTVYLVVDDIIDDYQFVLKK